MMATHEPNQSCNKSGCYRLRKIVAENREYISTFCNKICKCCTGTRNLIQIEASIHATCNYLICCKTSLNVSGKTHNITFQLVLQQCCKTSSTQQFSRSYTNSSSGANLTPYTGVIFGGVILTPKRSLKNSFSGVKVTPDNEELK